MNNPYESYATAANAQMNWENTQDCQEWLTEEEHYCEMLREELYSLRYQYPDADRDSLYKKLYQFAWVEEYDEVFDDLDLVVDDMVAEVYDD